LMVESTEGFHTLGAVDSEPLADLPLGHAEEVSDLVLSPAVGDPQDSGEALSDPLVMGLATAALDLLADLRFQGRCHNFPQTR